MSINQEHIVAFVDLLFTLENLASPSPIGVDVEHPSYMLTTKSLRRFGDHLSINPRNLAKFRVAHKKANSEDLSTCVYSFSEQRRRTDTNKLN